MAPKIPNDERSLEARIYAVYATLSPAEQRLADVLLQYQMVLPNHTASALAARAHVSNATAARLIRALGYATFPEAKKQIRAEQHWGSPQAGLVDPEQTPSGGVSLKTMVEIDLDNIRNTARAIPDGTLDEISRKIVAARCVWIMGLRSGYGLAHHAAHYLSLLRGDVHVLASAASAYSRDIATIKPGDLLLVIAFRRRPRVLPLVLAEARKAGATTVLITDLSATASARASTHVLRCQCQSPSPFNSFAAAVTLINYLAWSVASLLGEASVARFRKIDHWVGLLDDVSSPKSRIGRS